MTRQKSQPRPVLSGQLTLITLGPPAASGAWMTTASSQGTPISRPPPRATLRCYGMALRFESNNACLVGLDMDSVVGGGRWELRIHARIDVDNCHLLLRSTNRMKRKGVAVAHEGSDFCWIASTPTRSFAGERSRQ